MILSQVRNELDILHDRFNRKEFIERDPIVVPHRFSKHEDIEIAALFAAIFAWGQRVTIINKCNELMALMDDAPHDFLMQHRPKDLKVFESFKHRTFNYSDVLYFIEFLSTLYRAGYTLEDAFVYEDIFNKKLKVKSEENIGINLNTFRANFFSLEDYPSRTKKHISSPLQKSTCKRLNMFLRWMVRSDDRGVDFGIWKQMKMHQLVCPIDVHVEKVARNLNLIKSESLNWNTALELTQNLKLLDPKDPVKYDFALFGWGMDI